MTPMLIAEGREYELGDDVWNAWKRQARPFESPDDVLRRVLDVGPPAPRGASDEALDQNDPRRDQPATRGGRGAKVKAGKRVPSHLLLSESEYELPVLRALAEVGGRRPTREVIEAVGQALGDRLTKADKEPLEKGSGLRWQNRVQFVRLRLVREGLLKRDSPRGVWEISEAGEARLAAEAG